MGKRYRIAPQAFYQVNRTQTETLYQKAIDLANLTGQERVLDLYCGIGTIGLSLADRCKEMVGVEIVPQAIENAKVNADLNGIKNAEFFCADAKEAAARFAVTLAQAGATEIILAHLSQENNLPELAYRSSLCLLQDTDISLSVAAVSEPTKLV